MISNKLKSIFTFTGLKQVEYARENGISKSQLGNKIRHSAFSLKDLILLADRVDAVVVIRTKTGKDIVTFDADDLPKED